MTKAQIIALVEIYSKTLASSNTINTYFDEAVESLCKLPNPPLVNCEAITITSGTAVMDYPTNAIKILAVFYTSRQLAYTLGRELEHYSGTWRDDSGTPIAYTLKEESGRTYRLYPNPNTSTVSSGGAEPLGEDYAATAGAAIMYSNNSTTGSFADWLAYPLTFNVLAREFARPSAHQDLTFSTTCKQLSQLLYSLAGLGEFSVKRE